MTGDALWRPLGAALDRLAAQRRQALLWLRDDDAVEPTPALDRLLELADGHGVPVLLAIVPKAASVALAERVVSDPRVAVAVHGWRHQNHAPPGGRAQELGGRPLAEIAGELAQGLARLSGLFGRQLRPCLVPPWNRIAGEVIAALPDLGFAALSTFGSERRAAHVPGLCEVNPLIDLIDWKRGGGCRPWPKLVNDLAEGVVAAGAGSGMPAVGVLAHHLAHDEAAWAFLGELMARTVSHPGARWVDFDAALRSWAAR